MYSYKLVEAPGKCEAGCGTTVTNRLAGHYFTRPLCDSCFMAAAPELAGPLLKLQGVASIRLLESGASVKVLGEVRAATTCVNCGALVSGLLAGYHRGDALCVPCFRLHAPKLAALLLLEEAALKAASSNRYAEALLAIAVWYAKAIGRYRAEPPQDSRPGSDEGRESRDPAPVKNRHDRKS